MRAHSRAARTVAQLLLTGLLAVSGAVMGERARAGTVPDAFDQEVAEAQALYRTHDYEGAIAKLEDAYYRRPVARLLFNLGMAHRKLGHLPQALELFERYRAARGPDDRDAPVDRYIGELREQIAREAAAAKPAPVLSAQASKRDAIAVAARAPTALPAPVPRTPGLATSAGVTLSSTKTPGGASGREVAPSRGILRAWWFWTAVAAVIAGAGGAVLLSHRPDKPTKLCPVEPCVTAP